MCVVICPRGLRCARGRPGLLGERGVLGERDVTLGDAEATGAPRGLAVAESSVTLDLVSEQTDQIEGVDFALAVYREEGVWAVQEIAHDLLTDVETLAHALRRFPGDGGAVGLVGVDEDFFVVVRVLGGATRVLLSDVTAADEWELAASAVETLGMPLPDDEDEPEPAGDLAILADLGMSAMDMGILLDELLDDADLYPDEALSEVARKVGFGDLFDDAVGLTSA